MTAPATVLVTGAAGFFGLAITRALTMAGMPVIATDRISAEEFQPRRGSRLDLVAYVQRDLTSESVGDLIAQVSTVVHAAALTPGPDEHDAMLDTLLSVNLSPLPGVLEGIRVSDDCSRLVFVSSAGVYDQGAGSVLDEEAANGGRSLYGAAKLAAELVVGRYAAISEIEFCCLRPTSLFGPGEIVRPSRPRLTAFRQLVEAAAGDDTVRIENPDSRADWLHVDDAANAVAALARAPELPGCALNVSSGRPTALGAIAEELQRTIGLRVGADADVVISGGDDRSARITNERLRTAVQWSPQLSFADAAKSILTDAL
jgi:nucleoside-diphosphate-sugar epimerase